MVGARRTAHVASDRVVHASVFRARARSEGARSSEARRSSGHREPEPGVARRGHCERVVERRRARSAWSRACTTSRPSTEGERRAGPRQKICVSFCDGKLVGRQPDRLGSSEVVFDGIAVPSGTSSLELSAYAFNGDGVKSETTRRRIEIVPVSRAKARAWLVDVGVDAYASPNLDLSFAVADATALGDELEPALASRFEVHRVPLLGRRRGDAGGTRTAFRRGVARAPR